MFNKKMLLFLASISLLTMSSSSFAIIYLGAQIGKCGFINVDRGYIGNQFTSFLGLETGFAVFSSLDQAKTTEWDLLGKVGAPIGNTGFRADLKGGLSLIMSHFGSENFYSHGNWHEKSENDIRIIAGGSLTYNFNRNFGVDISYIHIFGDQNRGAFPEGTNIDMLTLGLNVQFLPVIANEARQSRKNL